MPHSLPAPVPVSPPVFWTGTVLRRRNAVSRAEIALGAAVALALCGCRSVEIGAPSVQRDTRTVYESSPSPTRSEVVAVRMRHATAGDGAVSVGLEMDVRDETARTSHTETTTVTTQRHLAYGFFPAAAEQYCAPKGAEPSPCLKHGYPGTFLLGLPFVPLGTLHSLLLEGPFGSYDCSKGKSRNAYAHLGLLGVHKYTTTVREGPVRGPVRAESPLVRRRDNVPVPGPFEIVFSIPDLNHYPNPAVAGRDGRATFRLPAVSRDQTRQAYVSFRPARNAYNSDALVPAALAKAAASTHAFDITLRAPPPPPPPPRKPDVAPKRPTPDPQPQPPPPPPRPYTNINIEPGENGRYVVRLTVLDTSKTFDIKRVIEPDVRQMIRDDFLSKNPGVSGEYVREYVQTRTEGKGGKSLVITGWAFSVRPLEDGWSYDAESRRGWIRIRILGGMPPDEAKRWARDNIAAIVAEKNVVLEAGKAPPPGATYRSLSERYENGVLTVEFEAVE